MFFDDAITIVLIKSLMHKRGSSLFKDNIVVNKSYIRLIINIRDDLNTQQTIDQTGPKPSQI